MKNKKLANIILVVVLLLFIVITLVRIFILDNFFTELLSFIAEAALVGGIADWFAVTALFKKPLGFSWHTAIIPKNKKKVIAAVSQMVEQELLGPEIVKSKIDQINLMEILIRYLDNKDIKLKIASNVLKHGKESINKLDKTNLSIYIKNFLKSNLNNNDLTNQIKKLYNWSIKNGVLDDFLDILIFELIPLAENKNTKAEISKIIETEIKSTINNASAFKRTFLKLSLGIAEGTDSVNTEAAAESLQTELIHILINIKNKDNPMRIYLMGVLEDEIVKLENNSSLLETLDSWRHVVLEEIDLIQELENITLETINTTNDDSAVFQWIITQLDTYWNNFKQDSNSKQWLENYFKESLYKVIKSEHHIIGKIVYETLDSFTDDSLNSFIENKAGNDLHWIRINGTIVGATVGLIIFLFINLFYDPIVVPIIKGLI